MINAVLEFHWSKNPIPINELIDQPEFIFDVPLGIFTSFETQVTSVQGKTGAVSLSPEDIGADVAGSADAVQQSVNALSTTVNQVLALDQINEMKIGAKSDQVDLETAEQQIEQNRLSILTKADIAALAMLAQLVDTKADQAYVNQQIANLVGSAPEALNTVYELAAAIQDNAGIIDTLNQSVANRVRFDVASQALTEIQKQNARTNIGAEESGTAAMLIAQITSASIGAATTAQGIKANTALQSGDVAPVALSGLFSSLASQKKIFDVVFGAYVVGAATAVTAADTLGQIIGKLQAQINNPPLPVWADINTIAAYPSHPSVVNANTKVEFAKINGMIWMRGYIRPTTALGNGDIELFTLFNNVDVGLVGTRVCPLKFYSGLSGELLLTATMSTDGITQYLSLNTGSGFSAGVRYNLQPACLGKARNP